MPKHINLANKIIYSPKNFRPVQGLPRFLGGQLSILPTYALEHASGGSKLVHYVLFHLASVEVV